VPRRYSLGKRKGQKDATRGRIVAAGAELFRVQGATRTSIAQIAAAADVAPGTVRNHFPSTEDLAAAVAEHVMDLLRMPAADIFDGVDEAPARVMRLARAMADYYERSQPWYRMADLDDRPLAAWAAAQARYDAEYLSLVRSALGPRRDDETVVAVVAGLLDPGIFGALARRGHAGNDAAALIGELLALWLAAPNLRR